MRFQAAASTPTRVRREHQPACGRYWTEARTLPADDLATLESLWLHYSDGKFGYTVQKDVWRRQKGVFDKFCDKIGWTTVDEATGAPRKRRWFGDSEFFYTLGEAPKGHLPLTSALRGTQLLKALLQHEVWENDGWKAKWGPGGDSN